MVKTDCHSNTRFFFFTQVSVVSEEESYCTYSRVASSSTTSHSLPSPDILPHSHWWCHRQLPVCRQSASCRRHNLHGTAWNPPGRCSRPGAHPLPWWCHRLMCSLVVLCRGRGAGRSPYLSAEAHQRQFYLTLQQPSGDNILYVLLWLYFAVVKICPLQLGGFSNFTQWLLKLGCQRLVWMTHKDLSFLRVNLKWVFELYVSLVLKNAEGKVSATSC